MSFDQRHKPFLPLLTHNIRCYILNLSQSWPRQVIAYSDQNDQILTGFTLQKALKSQAARNSAILNRTHLISLGVHTLFLLLSWLFFTRSLLAWFLLSLPSLLIEFWFERIGRPMFVGEGSAKELKKAGEDLEAKGLTEWMWDVIYWTWGCTALAAVAGNWAWYLYVSFVHREFFRHAVYTG